MEAAWVGVIVDEVHDRGDRAGEIPTGPRGQGDATSGFERACDARAFGVRLRNGSIRRTREPLDERYGMHREVDNAHWGESTSVGLRMTIAIV